MTKRITSKMTGPKSKAEYDASIDRIAELTVYLRKLEAKRDKALQTVREEHADQIDAAATERDALVSVADGYALDHRDELFPKDAKSASTAMATYGFRLGNPTLKTLSRLWTWDKVRDAVKATFGKRFVRTEESLDKDGIKAQLGNKPDELAKIGCRIEQTESFWGEPLDQPQEVQ